MITEHSNRLIEIDLIRCLVIIFVVLFHCLAPYCGGWPMPGGLLDNAFYWWIGKAVYCGMLEAFVCISGYVYAFTSAKRQMDLVHLAKNKTKRLLIPCIFWGIVFILIFSSSINWKNYEIYYSLLNGIGHLWFLPMLFWCFILEYVLNKFVTRPYIGLIIVGIIAVLPYPTLPFRFNNSLYYLFFFNLGYVLFGLRGRIMQLLQKIRSEYIIFFVIIYLLLFMFTTNLLEKPYFDMALADSVLEKARIALTRNILRLILSVMIFAIYFIVSIKIAKIISAKLFDKVYFISVYSFGIYLLQEIVIRLFYYKTDLPNVFGAFTPWVVFVLAITISTAISYFLHRNKITRYIC